jgi:hypothetical protein
MNPETAIIIILFVLSAYGFAMLALFGIRLYFYFKYSRNRKKDNGITE